MCTRTEVEYSSLFNIQNYDAFERVFLSDKLFDKALFVDVFDFLECLSWIAAIMMPVEADTLLKLNAI